MDAVTDSKQSLHTQKRLILAKKYSSSTINRPEFLSNHGRTLHIGANQSKELSMQEVKSTGAQSSEHSNLTRKKCQDGK